MKKWFILLFLVVLVTLLPLILSTPLGKPLIVRLLRERLNAAVSIEEIRLSWGGPQSFHNVAFSNSGIEGTIEQLQTNAPLWSPSLWQHSFALQNGSFSFPAYDGGSLTQVFAQIQENTIEATGATNLGGSLSIRGTFESRHNFHVEVACDDVPSAALDQVLKTQGFAYHVLGATFSGKGSMSLHGNEGSFACDLSSPNVTAALNAALRDNVLYLNEPFLMTWTLTKAVGEVLAQRANLRLFTSIESKTPIILRIGTDDFRLPINPFSMQTLNIGQGTLDLGQMRVQRGKAIRDLLKLLKGNTHDAVITTWFTPFAFQIGHGALHLGRLDALLANSVHICTWGDVDLQRETLDLFLGLPADALSSAFGLKNLPANYVLKVPIRGSLSHPDIDTQAASAKIAAMVAAQQLPGKMGGQVFGGILNVLAQPKLDENVPPAHRPFPWER